jgi:SHS2 domain-containing protein
MQDFELLQHTADIKIRAYGTTCEELFRNALRGMFQSIRPHIEGGAVRQGACALQRLPREHTIEVRAPDRESLLVDFLSEALYLSDLHNEAYLDADIHVLTEDYVKATIKGVAISGFEVAEIKAVTYNDLKITRESGVWQADVVFDI